MAMKLYYAPGAISLAAHIVLREVGADFELIRVDLRKRKTSEGGDFLDANPFGYVPVLELGAGISLRECTVILQYIADYHAGNDVIPMHGNIQRYQLQEWLGFLCTEVHKALSLLVERHRWRDAVEYAEIVREQVNGYFAWIDLQLAAKPYLMGDSFSMADALLWTLTNWGRADWIDSFFCTDVDLSAFDNLRGWHKRVSRRESVQKAIDAERLLRRMAA